MADTIRAYVERRLSEGAPLRRIYGEVRERYSRKLASFDYIASIERRFLRRPAQVEERQ